VSAREDMQVYIALIYFIGFFIGNASLVNLSSIIFCPSVNPLVIKNIITDGFTNGTDALKKLPASFRWYIPR
jgi:hypothetical protein